MATHDSQITIHAIIFSKDRAFQLEQLLRSLKKNTDVTKISVLYTVSPSEQEEERSSLCTEQSYQEVNSLFPDVRFVREEIDQFGQQLINLISESTLASRNNFINFYVDDLVVFDSVSVILMAKHMMEDPSILSIHMKLHPGIVWSHAASKPCVRPPLFWKGVLSDSTGSRKSTFLKFKRSDGTGDWDYPFDLCAGLYRMSDLLLMFEYVDAKHAKVSHTPPQRDADQRVGWRFWNKVISNPNKLEYQLDRAYQTLTKFITKRRDMKKEGEASSNEVSSQSWFGTTQEAALHMLESRPCSLCCEHSVLSVVTINCVQKSFKVPIYNVASISADIFHKKDHPWGPIDGSTKSLELLRRWCQPATNDTPLYRCCYDLNRYSQAAHSACSVHIGSLFLTPLFPLDVVEKVVEKAFFSTESMCAEESSVLISILMPIYNGEQFVQQALSSINAMLLELNHRQYTQTTQVEVVIVDDGSIDGTHALLVEATKSLSTVAKVVKMEKNQGITTALRKGLEVCRGKYVARMDVDDIATPARLVYQLHHLQCFNGLSAVGTAITLFNDHDHSAHQGAQVAEHRELRTVVHPTEPLMIKWSLLFSCCMSHPTVTFNRRVVSNIGSYRMEACGAEDYDLWLRLIQRDGGLSNLPLIGCHHRRHSSNETLNASKVPSKQVSQILNSEVVEVEAGEQVHGGDCGVNYDIINEREALHEWYQDTGEHSEYPLHMNFNSFAALRIVYSYCKHVLQPMASSTKCISLKSIALVRHLDTVKEVASIQDFESAVQLVLRYESYCLNTLSESSDVSTAATAAERGPSVAYESVSARELIRNDATNRIGELAVTAMAQHSSDAIDIWQIWAKRDVKGQMAMLKLMMK